MAFRLPISVMMNMTHFRNRHAVITVSEYLRLHGKDPESESSNGHWSRLFYHDHANVFETNQTKTPSLFVIQNHWFDPAGINRVDYIPEAMKRRGNLEHNPGPEHYIDGSVEYWPPLEPTGLSDKLTAALPNDHRRMDWTTAKRVLVNSIDLVGDVNIDDDQVVEELLNSHGWEVLHTFPTV